MKTTLKRLTALAAAALLLSSSACADWTCAVCGYTWPDGAAYCNECGFDAPVHGLKATAVGNDFIILKWYGVTTDHLTLLWSESGANQWEILDSLTNNGCVLRGLESGAVYDVQLMRNYEEIIAEMTVATSTGAAPAPEATQLPEPDATSTPEPAPSQTLRPESAIEPDDYVEIGDFGCQLIHG